MKLVLPEVVVSRYLECALATIIPHNRFKSDKGESANRFLSFVERYLGVKPDMCETYRRNIIKAFLEAKKNKKPYRPPHGLILVSERIVKELKSVQLILE